MIAARRMVAVLVMDGSSSNDGRGAVVAVVVVHCTRVCTETVVEVVAMVNNGSCGNDGSSGW